MFSKFFFTALIFTLALSASSSESTQAGRYRVEGPGNSGDWSAPAGRYHVSSADYAGSNANAGVEGWAQIGQSRVAGRFQPSESGYAMTRTYNGVQESAEMRTQRTPAADVSDKPANHAAHPDRK